LSWFGAQRRSYWNVFAIRRSLARAELETYPDFESAYIDSEIEFRRGKPEEAEEKDDAATVEMPSVKIRSEQADPTYRISKLAAANTAPTCVAPDVPLKNAVTLMMANDFSQLPVTTGEREIKGVVSWNSIGSRMCLGRNGEFVRDVMDAHQEIRADASIFQAIPVIVQHGYVLVRGSENRLTGIVTASDLSLQFQQLAEPYLLLGEIENHIRGILDGKFELSDLVAIRDPSNSNRKVEAISDLTFGEYLRLLEKDEQWAKLGLSLDRKMFCSKLDQVRIIRNDVMHFDPDGVPTSDLEILRDFARFLQRLQIIKAY
jgi:CBS domain-containing protein